MPEKRVCTKQEDLQYQPNSKRKDGCNQETIEIEESDKARSD